MEKKITVCVGTDRASNIRARLSLMLFEGGRMQMERYHSVSLAPGDDIGAKRSEVEEHLARADGGIPFAPWPKIPDAEWAKVEGVRAIVCGPRS